MTATVPFDELVEITGGRRRHRAQLEQLHARGFFRAYLGTNGKVVLERPHYEAVCAGQVAPADGKRDTPRPQLRSVQLRAAAKP